MKTLAIFILTTFTTFFAFAVNDSNWRKFEHKGDELKETSSYCSFSKENSTGIIVLYNHEPPSIKFINNNGIFNYKSEWLSACHEFFEYCFATVGIYDENGNIVKKGTMKVIVNNDKSSTGYASRYDESSVTILDIYEAMCKDGWSARFLMRTYGDSSFDVTITAAEFFKDISWIPCNIQRKVEAEREKKLLEENKRLMKEKEAKKRKIQAKIDTLKSERVRLQRLLDSANKNGYPRAAKQYKLKIEHIDKQLVDLELAVSK